MMNRVIFGDNLKVLEKLKDASVDLIYIDPPFNTRTRQSREQDDGTVLSYEDSFDGDTYALFMTERLMHAWRILKPTGSLMVHLDWHEVHWVKVWLDGICNRDNFQNEIIWAYDYGARSKTRWSAKHDNILWYVKDPKNYTFNYSEMERIPYMAPGLVGPEKAARGKTLTDVWWHTIVPTNGKEKTGYPTQKPLGIIKRIVSIHSNPDDIVLDFFAGSGTTGQAVHDIGYRSFILVDNNPQAIKVMQKRFKEIQNIKWLQVK